MKIKKALIPLALTALLAFGAAPVLAGDIISPATTGTADLRAQVDATYTVVIPASMTEDKSLKGGTNTIGALSATSLNLEPGTSLTCTLSGDTLTREKGVETLAYNAHFGADQTAKTTTLTESTAIDVNVEVDSTRLAQAKAGTYRGTLNFTLSVQ
ncbi:hypothetical protein [Eubacterium limosum]|jgi:periplasmic copper chaperone A|uniref:Fimbrial protein n=1 Tax=Eubacterium limosum TaxID=1736 RepID=A0AAC9QVU4_EUBLI|nr:hypothetical protein [Eubacterium limosum]ARD66540.1 hypothetical protein B2M23_13795 [Eubacterium limosum]PWW49684.1 hypothetical protein C7955_1116 [Eubacterium limosum]UQZ24763.1 hypothetical protein M5595_19925 [Eubacterium limosum]